ncbi:MAG: OmpA family protein [Gammaproteobacteria bacterium]|jgi:outer membrane protein OmpA-like peptidoglycan-associated protein
MIITKIRISVAGSIALWLVAAACAAQDLRATLFEDVDELLESARTAQADLLAPISFERGMDAYQDAEEDLARGRSLERIRAGIEESMVAFNSALQASEIARITLASLIKTRDDARNANAPTFAGQQWQEAEELFDSSARRLEVDDIRAARSRADEAEALYRDAELIAIKAQYLSDTRALLAQADQLRVERYAPRTLSRAQSLLEQAELELGENRYDTDYPRSLAQQANYQARHAIHLAELIREIRDDDATEEDLILRYEDPLIQIAAAADIAARLDSGTEPVVEEVTTFIEELRETARTTEIDLEAARTRIAELEEEIRSLDDQLGGVSQERVALVQRLEAEARIREQFAAVEQLFDREEARVSREGNDIILRLVGLTFPSGSAELAPQHRNLLDRVRQAADVFPRSQIVIEGHTDSYGSDETNLRLSRDRAAAVSAFLTSELGVPAFRITAVGYGETRPIANNETEQGRARNRRIDIRIEPQLD